MLLCTLFILLGCFMLNLQNYLILHTCLCMYLGHSICTNDTQNHYQTDTILENVMSTDKELFNIPYKLWDEI